MKKVLFLIVCVSIFAFCQVNAAQTFNFTFENYAELAADTPGFILNPGDANNPVTISIDSSNPHSGSACLKFTVSITTVEPSYNFKLETPWPGCVFDTSANVAGDSIMQCFIKDVTPGFMVGLNFYDETNCAWDGSLGDWASSTPPFVDPVTWTSFWRYTNSPLITGTGLEIGINPSTLGTFTILVDDWKMESVLDVKDWSLVADKATSKK